MPISAVQKNCSVIHIYTSFFHVFFIMVYPRRWDIVPYAVQQDPVVYLFYM